MWFLDPESKNRRGFRTAPPRSDPTPVLRSWPRCRVKHSGHTPQIPADREGKEMSGTQNGPKEKAAAAPAVKRRGINPASRLTNLHIRLDTPAYIRLTADAAEAGMTLQDYVKMLLGRNPEVVSKLDLEIFRKLFRFHADLNRLGNLCRLAVDQEFWDPEEAERLREQIRERCDALKDLISQCKAEVQQGGDAA